MSQMHTAFENLGDDALLLAFAMVAEALTKRIAAYSAHDAPQSFAEAAAALKSGAARAELRVRLGEPEGTIGLWMIGGEGEPIALVGQFVARTPAAPLPTH